MVDKPKPRGYSPKHLGYLLEKVDTKENFYEAYQKLTVKECTELYGIIPNDVYVLLTHWDLPLKTKSRNEKGRVPHKVDTSYTRRKFGDMQEPVIEDYPVLKKSRIAQEAGTQADARAAIVQHIYHEGSAPINYDKLADAIVKRLVPEMARLMVKGYLADR